MKEKWDFVLHMLCRDVVDSCTRVCLCHSLFFFFFLSSDMFSVLFVNRYLFYKICIARNVCALNLAQWYSIKENTVSTFILAFLSVFSFWQIKVECNRSSWVRKILKWMKFPLVWDMYSYLFFFFFFFFGKNLKTILN